MNPGQHADAVLVIIVPLLTAFGIPIIGFWRKNLCFYATNTGLFLALAFSWKMLALVLREGPMDYFLGGWDPPWGIAFHVDSLNAMMGVLTATLFFLVGISSKRSVEAELPLKEAPFYALFLLLFSGLSGMLFTGDMFNLYVFLEVSSLTAYALIAMGKPGALTASFRYLIMGTVGASWYLLGVGYLYIVTGSLNMADLARILPGLGTSKVVLSGVAFILVGIAIKMALFPLHAWLPEAYTHAPSIVSTTLAPLMTKVMAYVLIRLVFYVFKLHLSIGDIPVAPLLGWAAAVAVVIGSIYAIAQTDLKKMLSYSIVAQIGYIAMGIGLSNRLGLTGAVLHIVNEVVTKGCLFAAAGAIVYKRRTCRIPELRNLFRKMPLTMLAFTVGAFSMIGIPPTLGFFSKLYLILGSIEADQWIFAGILLLSSILNGVYFFRVIQIAAFEPPLPDNSREKPYEAVARDEVPSSMLIPMLIMAAGIFIFGIFSAGIVSTVIQNAIPADI